MERAHPEPVAAVLDEPGCKTRISDGDLTTLLDTATFAKLKRFKEMKTNVNYRECPRCQFASTLVSAISKHVRRCHNACSVRRVRRTGAILSFVALQLPTRLRLAPTPRLSAPQRLKAHRKGAATDTASCTATATRARDADNTSDGSARMSSSPPRPSAYSQDPAPSASSQQRKTLAATT